MNDRDSFLTAKTYNPAAGRPEGTLWLEAALLMLLTFMGILAEGYHLGFSDQEIYLPAIKHFLNPALYPHDAVFFLCQTKFTIFPKAIALLVRFSRLPLDWVLFLAHFFSIAMVLAGCLRLSRKMFSSPQAQWASVTLIAALFSLPIAGTGNLLVDRYLHPRTITTGFVLFSIVEALDGKILKSACWALAACVIDLPLAAPGCFFAVVFAWRQWLPELEGQRVRPFLAGAAVSLDTIFGHAVKRYVYLTCWTPAELLGLAAPLAILFGVSRMRLKNTLPDFKILVFLTAACGLFFAFVSLLLCAQPLREFALLQPLRALQIVYIVMFLVLGGLAGQHVLKNSMLRWTLFFLPLFAAMFFIQVRQLPAGSHIDWPGMKPRNQWARAFDWVRHNTPQDALFALDPSYMIERGEDLKGFRALAERSRMCDSVKDQAVVSVALSATRLSVYHSEVSQIVALMWYNQMTALKGWNTFAAPNFEQLKRRFGVDWVILKRPANVQGLVCAYRNDAVEVCRIP